MTVFPKGKHDDQVDSTAQFLDWYKKPFPSQGFCDRRSRTSPGRSSKRDSTRRCRRRWWPRHRHARGCRAAPRRDAWSRSAGRYCAEQRQAHDPSVLRADLIFDIPTLVSYCSDWTPLVAGDVISIGTPEGVGFARKPPLWMKPGDVVEVEIDGGIGVLRNPIIAES
jgi:hypothetical protein